MNNGRQNLIRLSTNQGEVGLCRTCVFLVWSTCLIDMTIDRQTLSLCLFELFKRVVVVVLLYGQKVMSMDWSLVLVNFGW